MKAILLPLIERYSYENQRHVGPSSWVIDIFLSLSIPYESLVSVLETMFYNDEVPFRGKNRRYIASDLLVVVERWVRESAQSGGTLLGSEDAALSVSQTLQVLLKARDVLSEEMREEAQVLRLRVEQGLRR